MAACLIMFPEGRILFKLSLDVIKRFIWVTVGDLLGYLLLADYYFLLKTENRCLQFALLYYLNSYTVYNFTILHVGVLTATYFSLPTVLKFLDEM